MSDPAPSGPDDELPVIRLIDEDVAFRRRLQRLLEGAGYRVVEYGCVGDMLLQGIGDGTRLPGARHPHARPQRPRPAGNDRRPARSRCRSSSSPPQATVHETLRAMKAGAADFFFKPVDCEALLGDGPQGGRAPTRRGARPGAASARCRRAMRA